MKRLSLQWRITLLTALLIACACVCMNLLLYRTGVTGMDALNGFMMQYQPGSADPLTIEIPQEEMSSLLAHFSQEVYDAKVVFGRKGWCITAVVTILSAAIAYFVSGRALKPLQQLAQQAQRVDQDSIATVRLDEDTVQEFGQLSRSVNRMLDGLAQSFELQRQFAGNAAHELRTPLAILQTKLELFAEEHPAMDAETAGLIRSLREQLDRLTALVRTLLEMSNLQSVSRTDQIALAPLVEEILTDLTPLAQKNNISLQQDCEELGMVGSDALEFTPSVGCLVLGDGRFWYFEREIVLGNSLESILLYIGRHVASTNDGVDAVTSTEGILPYGFHGLRKDDTFYHFTVGKSKFPNALHIFRKF